MMLNTELPYSIVRIKVSYQNYAICLYYRHRIELLIPVMLLYYSYIMIMLRKSFWS